MFQLLKDTRFDFMGKRLVLLSLSAALVVASIVVLWVHGLNMGIEFTGGTELQLRYAHRPDIASIREALKSAGMTSQVVTTIGDPSENEVYIRLGTQSTEEGKADDPTGVVLAALRGAAPTENDLNILDQEKLSAMLQAAPGLTGDQARALASAVLQARKERAIFHSFDDLNSVPGMTPEVSEYLSQHATIGPIALRSQSYIGPAVGRELVHKAIVAIIGSLIGMLVYIWIRFQLQWGFAAVVALTHDTIITLGLFSVFNQEMSLPVVAAFLTLIGYSVNDTVVVFDRIRENLQSQAGELAPVINQSINQTLSRTVITSGLTWIVVVCLFLFGGSALRPFSFVLTVGVLVGTYSSIWVASPFLVIWKAFLGKRRRRASAPAAGRKARKVRGTSG